MTEQQTGSGGPPPVDWSAVTPGALQNEKLRGGVYRGEGAQKVTAWACPACGAKNVSVFEEGCPECGAGKPGRHVGVDPIVRKAEAAALDVLQAMSPSAPFGSPSEGGISEAFLKFATSLGRPIAPDIGELLWKAFRAGADWGRSMGAQVQQLQPMQTLPPPSGTKESRTLVAALEFFKEQILNAYPEEISTGEWCNINEVDQLIARYKGEV